MSQAGILDVGNAVPSTVVETLTGNSGGAVFPDGAHNINVIGSGSISVAGNPGTHTLTISAGPGEVVQIVTATSSTPTFTTKNVPYDDGTTPTIANTDLLISLNITPTNAAHTLIFDFCAPIYSLGTPGFFLFQGNTLIGCYPFSIPSYPNTAIFRHFQTAGTIASTTFSVRYATDNQNTYVLQLSAGPMYGTGAKSIDFIITEVA